MMNGKVDKTYKIPIPFAVKINIYRRTAYFMYKEISGDWEPWKLVSFKLN